MTSGAPARTSRTAAVESDPPALEDRPLRRDAQRTRRRVLDAANELFAERGIEVGFDEIARLAGVGVGTVYRRFPDRESLVEALFSEKADQIVASASGALAVTDPWEAIVVFCERTIMDRHRDRGLADVLANPRHGHRRLVMLRDQMAAILGELLDRAQRAGVVRADLQALDLAVMTHLLSRITVEGDTEIWRRYLTLFFDAIRTRPGIEPLAGPVPTLRMFEDIAQRL